MSFRSRLIAFNSTDYLYEPFARDVAEFACGEGTYVVALIYPSPNCTKLCIPIIHEH
jgi:hypothetical protein